MPSSRSRPTGDSACPSRSRNQTGNEWTWCCEHAATEDFQRAVRLLQPHLPLRNLSERCCNLRPAEVRVRCTLGQKARENVAVRVWPGAGGASLFALQVSSVAGNDILAWSSIEPAFEVTLQSGATIHLRGLADYGTASYCAAIGQVLDADDERDAPHVSSAPAEMTLQDCSPQTGPQDCSPEMRSLARRRVGRRSSSSGGDTSRPTSDASSEGAASSSLHSLAASEWIDVLLSAADLMDSVALGCSSSHTGDRRSAAAGSLRAGPGDLSSGSATAVRVTAWVQCGPHAGGHDGAAAAPHGSGIAQWAPAAPRCNAQLLDLLGLCRERQSLQVPYVRGPGTREGPAEGFPMLEIMDVTDLRALERSGFPSHPQAAATLRTPQHGAVGSSCFLSSFPLEAAPPDAPNSPHGPHGPGAPPTRPCVTEVEIVYLSGSLTRGLPHAVDLAADTLRWDDGMTSGRSTDGTDMFGALYGNGGAAWLQGGCPADAVMVHGADEWSCAPGQAADCTCCCPWCAGRTLGHLEPLNAGGADTGSFM